MTAAAAYLKDPAAIYQLSFETVRREADLARFSADEQVVAERLIHACGMPEIAADLIFSPASVAAGVAALRGGAPILCDCKMVAAALSLASAGITNPIICRLNAPEVALRAKAEATTRSAAQIPLWRGDQGGAVIAIGNAPTALFRLLEEIEAGAPKPALILGFPVGFVGAAESKEQLAANRLALPFITLAGRRGGSPLAGAAVNALARLAANTAASTPGATPSPVSAP